MTKSEAIHALKSGKKIIHRYFMDDEFIYYRHPNVIDEKGYHLGSIENFMSDRTSSGFNDDWDIHESEIPPKFYCKSWIETHGSVNAPVIKCAHQCEQCVNEIIEHHRAKK